MRRSSAFQFEKRRFYDPWQLAIQSPQIIGTTWIGCTRNTGKKNRGQQTLHFLASTITFIEQASQFSWQKSHCLLRLVGNDWHSEQILAFQHQWVWSVRPGRLGFLCKQLPKWQKQIFQHKPFVSWRIESLIRFGQLIPAYQIWSDWHAISGAQYLRQSKTDKW